MFYIYLILTTLYIARILYLKTISESKNRDCFIIRVSSHIKICVKSIVTRFMRLERDFYKSHSQIHGILLFMCIRFTLHHIKLDNIIVLLSLYTPPE